MLLLAVPGSGKTTVLVSRLGYMIHCCGIAPSNILTLTYTVAAAGDMRERYERFFGEGTRMARGATNAMPQFRTINSLCAGIITYYGRQIGKTPYTLETDDKVLLAILSQLYQQFERDYPTESDLREVARLITYIKNMMLTEGEIRKLDRETGLHLYDIYTAYCRTLKDQGKMDFDDQMVYAYRLLKSSPVLLSRYQEQFPYICVDEAQDTSKIQHAIIALLASKSDNLFLVGDEDQSIYGFRAAYPDALLSFEEDHPGAKVLLMEKNYRSGADIVSAADHFIRQNTLRHDKHMQASIAEGSKLREVHLRNREAQYNYLLEVAKSCAGTTAVLYRDHESVIPLVDLLDREAVPYKVRNADPSFFTSRIVTDILNILTFTLDPSRSDLFERFYYKISTYLNKQLALRVCRICAEDGSDVFDVIQEQRDLNGHTRASIRALATHFRHMQEETPLKAIHRIVSFMGYGDYMERAGMSDGKVATLKILAGRESSIEDFLYRMEDLRELMRNPGGSQSPYAIILSTIHASKGLEYDTVYLIDVQDGLFPESVPRNLQKPDEEELGPYEEERRLFYVGVTRARRNLILLRTQTSSILISQLLKGKAESGMQGFIDQHAEGLGVRHVKYGEGVITALDGKRVTILFGDEEKTFGLKVLYEKDLLED